MAQETQPSGQAIIRDPALTGLRALAIGLVLISHMAIAQGLPRPWMIKGSGQLGVMLFFLLSGYLMARIYGTQAPDRQLVRRFTLARAGRVLPAYLVVIAVSFAVAPWDPLWPYQIVDLPTLARHLLMIEGQNALWAVPIEVQFYAVFLVVWLIGRGRFFHLLVLIALPLCWLLNFGAVLPDAATRPLAIYLPYFLGGCALGLWLPGEIRLPGWAGWLLCVVASLALLLAFPYLRRHFGAELPMWRDPIVFVTIVMVFLATLWRAGAFALLTHPVAVWVGTISYGLYLWNPLALSLVGRWAGENPFVTPLLMAGLSFGFGWVSWVLVERPALRWTRSRLT